MPVDKKVLLKARLPTAVVELEGVGEVRVRGLSRAEVLYDLKAVDRSVEGAFERRLVSLGMVEPELTEDEVAVWQQGSPSQEIEEVTDKIATMSGLADTAAKDAYKEFESDPDESFRVLPGGEAVDDGGAAEG